MDQNSCEKLKTDYPRHIIGTLAVKFIHHKKQMLPLQKSTMIHTNHMQTFGKCQAMWSKSNWSHTTTELKINTSSGQIRGGTLHTVHGCGENH